MTPLANAGQWMPGLGFGMATAWDREEFPQLTEEVAASVRMLPARRRDFLIGRTSAYRALANLGVVGERIFTTARAPQFPPGFVGSLSHSRGIAVAIAAPESRFCAVGIDLELNPLPDGAAHLVLSADEAEWFQHGVCSCTEAFSAKEAAYKALDTLLEGGAPPLRRMRLEPVAGGFWVRLPCRPGLNAFVSVRRVGLGVLAWMTVPVGSSGAAEPLHGEASCQHV